MSAENVKQHQGRCHCGVVRFEVEVDMSNGGMCNCSICAKVGAVGAIVKPGGVHAARGRRQPRDVRVGREDLEAILLLALRYPLLLARAPRRARRGLRECESQLPRRLRAYSCDHALGRPSRQLGSRRSRQAVADRGPSGFAVVAIPRDEVGAGR